MGKLTAKQVEKAKEMKNNGLSITKIAKKFGVSAMGIQYHVNPVYRKHQRESVERWRSKNGVKFEKSNREWRRNHPLDYLKSITFSNLRRGLKEGWIMKKEVLKQIKIGSTQSSANRHAEETNASFRIS